jgi:ABC-type phosphate transport system permease subunit
VIASLVGWVLDSLIEPFLGVGARVLIGIMVGVYAYVYARNWLLRLRDGG